MTRKIFLPSSESLSKVERSAAVSSSRPLLGGSAPTDGCATASVSYLMQLFAGDIETVWCVQSSGTKTIVGLDMLMAVSIRIRDSATKI